jgi:hypothetical protein
MRAQASWLAWGAHGVLVTAVSVPAFGQALRMVRAKGTVSLVGLPPGEFPTPILMSSSNASPFAVRLSAPQRSVRSASRRAVDFASGDVPAIRRRPHWPPPVIPPFRVLFEKTLDSPEARFPQRVQRT